MVSDAPVTPYSDELYYSLVARANARWRFPSRRTIGELAYQKSFVVSSLELPGHLEDGVAFLLPSPLYSVDHVIDHHTLLPLFSPFLPVERTRQLRADMHGSPGASIYVRSGLKASSVPSPDCLRYCQRCADEDRQRVGETYWRRIHQVVGVEVCPEHGGALQNAHARLSRLHTAYEYIAAEDVISHQPDTDHGVSGDATDQILRHPVFTFVAQNAA